MRKWSTFTVVLFCVASLGCNGRSTLTDRVVKSFKHLALQQCEEQPRKLHPCACEFARATAEVIGLEKLPDEERVHVLVMLEEKPDNLWDITSLVLIGNKPVMAAVYHWESALECLPVNDPTDYVQSLRDAIHQAAEVEAIGDELEGKQKI